MAVQVDRRRRRQDSGSGPPHATGALCAVLCLCTALAALTDAWRPAVAVLLIGPVLACAWLGVRATVVAVVWSVALAVAAGAVRRHVASPPLGVEYLVLLAGSCTAIQVAHRTAARAAALARVTEIARVAQGALLRPVSVRVGDVDVSTRHHCPTAPETVGGDVYDIAETPYGLRVFIGDVRGHGLDVVRTTAAVAGGFRDLAYVTPHLTDLAEQLDARIALDLGPEDFVTGLFAEFAPGELRLVNCGHPPPLRLGSGRPELLEPVQPARPLGLGACPGQRRYWLQQGDRVLFYTDGLTEARDASGVDFPLLQRGGDALGGLFLGDALDALYEALTEHTGAPIRDDVALVLCERSVSQGPGPALPGAAQGDQLRRA
ncbi:PP2C family protein-serine/threonine phosphatase [Streptomyces sp. NPDC050085]|uniref:PP2C family protein-serine/threonine phosphatase n=1 Tax=Streptomyces sp. NPDC050085 TaxID=3365600 RepID=UPI0037BBB44E